MKKLFSTILLFFLFHPVASSQRLIKTINSGWEFSLEGQNKSKTVNIPHTWNAKDAFKDDTEYFRGKGIYQKEISIPENWKDRSVFIKFEGANQETKVYVNDQFAGEHIGGYTSFVIEISNLLEFEDKNILRIEVDNSHNNDIPPLEADFNFYGGIYRDIELVVTGKSHFKLTGPEAGNLLIKTPEVSQKIATVSFQGEIVNPSKELYLQLEITDPLGNIVFKNTQSETSEKFSIRTEITNPQLWSPDTPNLYQLKAELIDRNSGEIQDSYISKFGCRWFEANPEKGFILNGKPIKLIGANRHQDFDNMGNAVPNSLHRKDYQMIKDMGSNFIRTAHYPQDSEVYKICDKLGLLVWTEIPVINDVTDSEAYHQNSVNMLREQILQLQNHPSIVFWGYMNEIFIRLVFTGNMPEADKAAKIKTSIELARKLEAETKKLDSSRLSVMALHDNNLYNTTGIADIPDVIGWNLYFGWYTQGLENLGKFLDEQHKKYPDRPILISEYGPGSDSRIQTNTPKPWDYSEAYQLKSHVSYLNQVIERDYMIGMAAWNFADFGSSGRQDSRPYINQKGLVNFDREPKDIYYYYKARLAKENSVFIAGGNFEHRFIEEGDSVNIKVFSSSPEVDVIIDDNEKLTTKAIDHIASFSIPLSEGTHLIKAISNGKEHQRKLQINFRDNLIERLSAKPIQVNIGSHSDFIDEETGEIWISDQEYFKNNFGFTGGKVYQQSENKFQGSASNIKLTTKEPLYQTMREGINKYTFDVPKGKYRISLLMTEPNRKASKQSIYNLGSETLENTEGSRIFDILINGKLVESNLNLAADYGILTAVELNYTVFTATGLEINFRSISGEPILSGIRIEKL
ncbi:glycoside hydrolase family 2 TIM barrel-domain containing protein [Christiangramia sp. SM2212]|uniref:Glycoside hydrolase family 2 TIM barrel-domain containing protein n=1 Tax=Christiangramia sediminicola TaxID=3073267 RepID=A0ABU1EMF0_9FLAO|nr:glycoside hydrolase family 2 TIM barrel-domain containing protein [Christiangramia sp. SM2212]MDR5589542.1 glycoside hydrolase family 2 TIM barrel-domain containing protein [Christiangramia sp. SM2212]